MLQSVENKIGETSPYRLLSTKTIIRQLGIKTPNRLIFIYLHLFPP